MKSPATRPKLFLAILAFLVAIFACTALLRAQNLPPQNGPDTPASGDPAKHQLPFECFSEVSVECQNARAEFLLRNANKRTRMLVGLHVLYDLTSERFSMCLD